MMLNMACERWWFSCCCVNLFIITLGFSIVIAERGDSLYHYDISSLTHSDNAAEEFIQFYPHDEFRRKRRSSVRSSPLSESNITRTVNDTHHYYNSSLYVDEVAVKKIWINMDEHPNVTVNHVLSNSHRNASTVELSFDFPFYGQPIRNVTILTDGFLYTGDHIHSRMNATQYIAPLMANFDPRLSNNSYVKYADNGTAFIVEWENMVLQEQPEAGGFTFQVTLYKNGDIVFIYAAVPLVIDHIQDDSHPVKVGLSDAYIIERTVYSTLRKTIYEYHSVSFKDQDIKNWTVIYLSALPTCVEMDNCNDCLSRSTGFECMWCPSLNRCSTGIDRHRQDWMSECKSNNIAERESCPINNKTTSPDELEHDTQAVHKPEGSFRGAGVLSDHIKQPSHEANAPGPIEHNSGDADLASDDIDINKFDDVTNSPLSENHIIRTVDGTHEYYNSSLYVDEVAAKKIWININEYPNGTINHVLSNGYRKAWRVELSFDFPFYGQPVRNVTIATGGFMYTGDNVHSWLAATQYIAPLMADFDGRLSNNSYIKYADNGTAFTVEWENVVLQEQPKTGGFTFQVTLHKNGDIVFIYAAVPLAIDQIQDNSHPVKVGLSDAYIVDKIVFLTRRKTIYEYHRVNLVNQDIKNWTVIYLSALPTCVKLDNCNDCLSRSTGFECKWCPSLNRCSTGIDRHRQDWISKCELNIIKKGESCPVINNKTTNYIEHEHFTHAVHEPEGFSHEANAASPIEHSTGQETGIGTEKFVSRKNQSTEIESQPSEVSNFSVEFLESKAKDARKKAKAEKSKEELSNLSKFFLNIAETVETFPKIYQREIKSQVFELVSKYDRQMILAAKKSDKKVQLNATLPVF